MKTQLKNYREASLRERQARLKKSKAKEEIKQAIKLGDLELLKELIKYEPDMARSYFSFLNTQDKIDFLANQNGRIKVSVCPFFGVGLNSSGVHLSGERYMITFYNTGVKKVSVQTKESFPSKPTIEDVRRITGEYFDGMIKSFLYNDEVVAL